MAGEVGEIIGNYRLLRVIGEGGFATVYLGEHRYLGRQAAIKVVDTQLEDEDVESFLAESQLVARLTHPNILRVMEYGVEGGVPFLIMEYAPNGTLRTRHPAGGPVPVATVIPYVQQVAEALHYAHEQKIIHRDIKPENLLLGKQGQVLLADFGIAVVAQSSRSSSGDEVAGTIAYMAPEQLQGRPRPASDQYSLAVVVYELLTGERPFSGSYAEVAAQHVMSAPLSLRAKVPTLPPIVEDVVLIALAKDPKDRFASIRAFAKGLENALAQGERVTRPLPAASGPARPTTPLPSPSGPLAPGLPEEEPTITPTPTSTPVSQTITPALSATPTPTPTPSSPESGPLRQSEAPPKTEFFPVSPATSGEVPKPEAQPRRVLRRSVLVGLTGLAIAGGVVSWQVLAGRLNLGPLVGAGSAPTPAATATATPVPTATATLIPLGTTLYTYTGHVANVNALCWAAKTLRIASASSDYTVRLWDALTGGNELTYMGHSNSVNTVAWSSDDLYIASGDSSGYLQIWSAVFGSGVAYLNDGPASIHTADWSGDATRLIYGGDYSVVHIVQAPAFTPIASLVGSDPIHAAAWSKDGTRIASGTTSRIANKSIVQVWNAITQQHLFDTAGRTGGISALAWSPDGSKIAAASFAGVDIWDAVTGKNITTYHGHAGNYVLALGWSPDGKTIASGGADGTVQLWDATTFAHNFTYKGAFQYVNALAWSPDGKLIASAGDDKVEVWVAAV
ncbi:MAG TPA: serine/threonine-protein kinase [Ktedonobacterales bacterium]|jgi:serine/threonine protein kinase